MCGIAGILRFGGARVAPDRLAAMVDGLAHRGPDDRGYLGAAGETVRVGREPDAAEGATVGLGHTRLSILDLSAAGHQPMGRADGSSFLVFNGEIYNHVELRAACEARGERFASRSDTEVLLAKLAERGTEALGELVGMYAFAWLDRGAGRLVLARDPYGIKPLYWTRSEGRFAFASEIPALLAADPGAARTVNPARLYDYLRFGLTDDGAETLLADVAQVPPGHWLAVDLASGELEGPVAFRPPEGPRWSGESFADAAERTRELFLESLRLHRRSDVPLGAALSGGIDSSAILCGLRHVEGPGADLRAFSYVADDPALSEARYVGVAAEAAGARVATVTPRVEELVTDLDTLVARQGLPFGSTSIYAQYRVFQLAAGEGVKVLLDGQGADEIFAGYRTYLATRWASLVRARRFGEAGRYLARVARQLGPEAKGFLARAGGLVLPSALTPLARRMVGEDLAPAWLEPRWFAERGVEPRPLWRSTARDALREHLHEAVSRISLPMLLRYEDRNSMAFSLESRVPFLDPRLVGYALSLPEEHWVSPQGQSKAVFRAALRGIVPDEILDRRDKIGFATPERRWLRAVGPWVEEVLAGERARAIPALRPEAMLASWQGVRSGSAGFDWRIWRWLNLVRWAEQLDVVF